MVYPSIRVEATRVSGCCSSDSQKQSSSSSSDALLKLPVA